ncbi:MerR family transcriptional regulator [Kozakia baliensis]|uniref:Uncharacterized protein n=1 Tax=Kozakia baliensis TaxID=153496 RepID=A0A1D8UTH2_9PROT|nr:helix-turn-helix domain-containing protein [Kozakia baliensis]AOX16948.1 hypothetical protein A0U89_07120 [Kozakia baliensis]GBR25497.1 hypothetical protein AA0488_0662 [Kozakia baliensis NRIC 0488]GEL64004.1 hypothetical protein KBA01_12900 [Kozakia baliensis]
MSAISATIPDAVKQTGLSRTKIYELLSEGMIQGRKAGTRTLILMPSLRRYIENLPPAEIAISPRREGAHG